MIITGEGRLDQQTLSGKVISGVCKAAREYKVPVETVGLRTKRTFLIKNIFFA
ncbi:glycerate kinase [Paenibacillus sp. V4I5]|uniref:glycerate kinase n=1 Tax=Paenibacillus sp. V4I5 TaxID=3042306 RepID=UPI0035936314